MSYSYGQTLVYTDADFRAQFPFFANATTYPEAQLQLWFTMATNWISNTNLGTLNGASRQLALYLMTAHLQAQYTAIVANGGAANNTEITASIDKIRVTVATPMSKNAWQQWLNQTPWGQQLLTLLSTLSVGGFQVGGNPERAAFRRVFGGFG